MAALTKGRLTPRREGDILQGPVAASTTLFAGAMVMREADGYLSQGRAATGLVGAGVAEKLADNSAGADGDITVSFRAGVWRMENSAGADEITIAEIGDVCFAVDDQTVAKTDGSSARSPAGIIDDVDTGGVWVRFDEALTKAS